MKAQVHSILVTAGLLAAPCLVQGQPTAHYVPGVEGIKGASLPPPGFYVRDYNLAYYADRVNTPTGDDANVPNFKAFTYANVPRVIYITDTKFLGGYVGVDFLIPFVYQDAKAGPWKSDTFGIGDIFAESTLSWHLQQFDFSAGAGVYMPTGDSEASPTTKVGQGYWTPMLTAGATWFIDQQKTWAVSALNRYEFNTEQRDMDYTPGQAYTLEWGVSKAVCKAAELGVVGYYQQQVTGDSGRNRNVPHDRGAGIGPEISVAFPEHMFFASLRYLYDFMAESRAQGHTIALTLTKRF